MRDMGGEFAAEFPKVAARLGLGSTEVADPYVERLLEGFAFLTARVQLKMEAEFPTFTQSLLQMVYPHYLAPTPVHGGGALRAGRDAAGDAGGRAAAGRHRAAQPARHGGPDQLRVPHRASGAAAADRAGGGGVHRLARGGGGARPAGPAGGQGGDPAAAAHAGSMPFARLPLDSLVVVPGRPGGRAPAALRAAGRQRAAGARAPHRAAAALAGEPAAVQRARPRLRAGGGAAAARAAVLRRLPAAAGIPRHAGAVPVRRLRRAGPRRRALRHRRAGARAAAGPRRPAAGRRLRRRADAAVLHAGDQPVPPPRRPHQPRGARGRAPGGARPHAPARLRGVRGARGGGLRRRGQPPQPFLPFYAANDLQPAPGHRAYYTLRRQPRQLSTRARQRGPRSAYVGHDVFISLVDAEQAPYGPGLRQLGLDLLCTNRDLPLAMPVGRQHTDFTLVVSAPVASVRCVVGPVAPRPCRGEGELRLALHLPPRAELPEPVRHRQRAPAPPPCASCCGSTCRRERLGGGAAARGAAVGVLAPGGAAHPRRGPRGGGARARGHADDGRGAVRRRRRRAAGAVLERFFAKYVSINAFTETTLRCTERGEVMRWPMQIGLRPTL